MKNKKGFTLIELIGVVTVLALIALIVYPTINTVIKNSKEKAYKDQVELVIKAAKQWGMDHSEELPDAGGTMTLSIATLLQNGYITNDDVIDPRETGRSLSGSIIIRYASNQYIYEYSTETFKTAIATWLKENKASQLTDGVYKGTNPDNYVNFNGEKWRIVKINSDDTVRIIRNETLTSNAWDSAGTGSWTDSSLKRYLNVTYYNSLKDSVYLSNGTWCIGTIGDNYCETSENAYVGLISANEYVEASANSSCTLSSVSTCGTNNYLKLTNINYYTITRGGAEGFDHVYMINNGTLTNSYTSLPDMTKTKLAIRPVVNLKSTVKIVGGNGNSSDPFALSI